MGLVQRCSLSVCRYLNDPELKKDRKLSLSVSFLQLYNEKIYDLLNDSMFSKQRLVFNSLSGNPKEGLKLKWNPNDVYVVENLTNVEINTYDDILYLYHYGINNKAIGSHKMNLTSSRSHTVLCLTLEQIHYSNPDNTIVSKLQIVDLAGSERQSLTAVEGQ